MLRPPRSILSDYASLSGSPRIAPSFAQCLRSAYNWETSPAPGGRRNQALLRPAATGGDEGEVWGPARIIGKRERRGRGFINGHHLGRPLIQGITRERGQRQRTCSGRRALPALELIGRGANVQPVSLRHGVKGRNRGGRDPSLLGVFSPRGDEAALSCVGTHPYLSVDALLVARTAGACTDDLLRRLPSLFLDKHREEGDEGSHRRERARCRSSQ
jgi:hypothetical protein